MTNKLEFRVLSSGWIRLKIIGSSCFGGWAQIPSDYADNTIADEYIFQPEWNRHRINELWRIHNAKH